MRSLPSLAAADREHQHTHNSFLLLFCLLLVLIALRQGLMWLRLALNSWSPATPPKSWITDIVSGPLLSLLVI